MKKPVFLALSFCSVFLLISCTLDNTTIINNSSETVDVTFRHTGLLTIPPGGTISAATTYRMAIVTYAPEEWVAVRQELYLIVFEDRERFPIRVRNFSDAYAILTITGRTRPMDMSPLTVEGLEVIGAGYYIYTRQPQFTAIDGQGFQMRVAFTFYDGIFMVSIHH